jgi:hypothetical protein
MGWQPTHTDTDPDAIHDNVAGEISAITEKVTPVDGDWVLIEDSAASNAKKKAQLGNLPGAAGGGGDLTLIAETVLASPATNIEFSSITGAHRDLMLLCELRTDRAAVATDEVYIRVGNTTIDSGNNYTTRRRYEGDTGSTIVGEGVAQVEGGIVAAATAATGSFAAVEFKIFGYADTDRHKLFIGRGVFVDDTIQYDSIFSGRWANTSAIDIIRLIPETGTNFVTGSRIVLYALG